MMRNITGYKNLANPIPLQRFHLASQKACCVQLFSKRLVPGENMCANIWFMKAWLSPNWGCNAPQVKQGHHETSKSFRHLDGTFYLIIHWQVANLVHDGIQFRSQGRQTKNNANLKIQSRYQKNIVWFKISSNRTKVSKISVSVCLSVCLPGWLSVCLHLLEYVLSAKMFEKGFGANSKLPRT